MHLIEQGTLLRVEGLKKVFRSGGSDLVLFENLSFQVAKGEMLAIVGESGAGKSTLLHILGALDRPSAGDVYCAHLRLSSLSEDDAAEFRNREIGFVWQFHYLLPEFTALENVAMPLLLRGDAPAKAAEKRRAGCAKWGWSRARIIAPANFPAASNSGWRWRGRLSRKPKLLLADEPTGDLDSQTADAVFELISRLASRLPADVFDRHPQLRICPTLSPGVATASRQHRRGRTGVPFGMTLGFRRKL